MPLTDLDWRLFNYLQLEAYDRLNFLKGAIVYSNLLNTVSPTYAREIQTPYYGWGLQHALRERKDRLFGIVNGVDYSAWKTAGNLRLPASYRTGCIEPRKPQSKTALQHNSNACSDA